MPLVICAKAAAEGGNPKTHEIPLSYDQKGFIYMKFPCTRRKTALNCWAASAAGIVHILSGLGFLSSTVICAFTGRGGAAAAAVSAFLLSQIPFLFRKWCVTLPPVSIILWNLFLLSSVLCGEILDFYTRFAAWDLGVHFLAGFLFAAAGAFPFYRLQRQFGPAAAVSAFSLSLSSSLLWEFAEFACDFLFQKDMQRDTLLSSVSTRLLSGNSSIDTVRVERVTVNGTPWPGYIDIGLIDTMTDLLAGAAGAAVFLLLALFALRSSRCRSAVDALVPGRAENVKRD